MDKTTKELKFKILNCYWSCYYHFGDDFDSTMAHLCIDVLLLQENYSWDFQTAAMKMYDIFSQDIAITQDEVMSRDSVLASIAWWYFHKEEMDVLINGLKNGMDKSE